MKVAIIAAMADNRVIGINNQLPWHLPADLAWFKKNTRNKIILLGRKTWESLPIRPLPERQHIILSQNRHYRPLTIDGKAAQIPVADSIDKALAIATAMADEMQQDELMIIGGASIYQMFLPLCSRLYLTRIHQHFDGDAWFPDFDPGDWQVIFSEQHEAVLDNKAVMQYEFQILERI